METSVWVVAFAALITALATGLGALPFLFIKNMSKRLLGISNAGAAGLMLGASIGLIYEGNTYSLVRTLIGAALGLFFIRLSHNYLEGKQEFNVGRLEGADALEALMIMGVMTLHSFSEGVGVGVSFGGGDALGELITIAIAIHNIPEGLAISLVLIPRGISVWKSAGWSIFSSLPQPLMAVPAFLFVTVFEPFLPVGLGFAAGAMVWMVFSELMPEALEDASRPAVGATMSIAVVAMLLFQALIGG